jgi:hypothetical protein
VVMTIAWCLVRTKSSSSSRETTVLVAIFLATQVTLSVLVRPPPNDKTLTSFDLIGAIGG